MKYNKRIFFLRETDDDENCIAKRSKIKITIYHVMKVLAHLPGINNLKQFAQVLVSKNLKSFHNAYMYHYQSSKNKWNEKSKAKKRRSIVDFKNIVEKY